MTEIRQERYINPYTDFGIKKLIGKEQDHVFKKLFGQVEIAKYDETERRLCHESRKEFWACPLSMT